MDERKKLYVSVNADHLSDGRTRPRLIVFDSGESFEIDRVCDCRRAASTKVGGTGVRYTVRIGGKETFLFDEENGRWFVEARCRAPGI